jgi:hypothetical protein
MYFSSPQEKMEAISRMKDKIETLSKYHQIEILKILSKNLCKLNENKSGVYVNLTYLPEDTIAEMQKYLDYTKDQEEALITMEYQKEEFKNAFFIEKEDKDITLNRYSYIC